MGSANLYGRRWRVARERFLALHPTCALCAQQGRVVPATVVDHIEPHRGDATKFWRTSNWQSLCSTCHSASKQAQERSGYLRGSTVEGLPLDGGHPWYQEAEA